MNTPAPKQFNILLIGDHCEDVYHYGTVDRISPEAPVPVFVPAFETRRAGMAGNVCKNLEALGCNVNYLHGKTSVKTRLIDNRSKQQLMRIDQDEPSDPIRFDSEIPDLYDAVVISDYNKGTVDYNLIATIRDLHPGPIFIDTKKTDLQHFNGCYVKINHLEYSRAISLPEDRWLIVTHGEKGTVYCGDALVPASVPMVDVTGAGDTFLAALCYKFLQTQDMREAIVFANRAAGVTVQHVGVYAPTPEEIR